MSIKIFNRVKTISLREKLIKAEKEERLPSVTGFHRIDGPGSSLELPVIQRYLWKNVRIPENLGADAEWSWSSGLPRTVGITINTGIKVTAYPFTQGMLAMESKDYSDLKHVEGKIGHIIPDKKKWIIKIMEILGLDGVKFVIKNLCQKTRSSGLGGSATATITSAILANHLAGEPFDKSQLVALASFCENDCRVSITGTQEQWNVLQGGIVDYVWFPWGMPGKPGTGYGSVLSRKLVLDNEHKKLSEISKRILLVHSGKEHKSDEINRQWIKRFYTKDGYLLHKRKPDLAYQYAEAIRLGDWSKVSETVEAYGEIRVKLCPDYIKNFLPLYEIVKDRAVLFPLGAGGGGIAMIWMEDPAVRSRITKEISLLDNGFVVDYKILNKGHMIANPLY